MKEIEVARKKAGLSQIQLAKLIGVSQGAISQWENGISSPSTDKIPDLAAVLHCGIDKLFAVSVGRDSA